MLMLKEMEYVYAVYEEQSFSKAARKLYLSQPALSAAVRRAEAEIHTPIFDRSTNPIRLTAAGAYYIDAVKRILDIRQEMESYFDALAGECQGSVRVGAASFFCAHVLPSVAEEFQQQYPAWRASLLEVNAPDLYPCLQSGTIDLSLSPNFFDNHLTINLNGKGVYTHQRYANSGAVGSAAFFNPTIDPYWRNEDGSIDYSTTNGFWNYGSGRGEDFTPNTLLGAGPLSLLYDRDNYADAMRFIGNAQFDYKVHGFEALRLNLSLGMDISNTKIYDGVNPGSFQAYTDTEARGWGQFTRTNNFRRNQVLEFYANYNEEWGIHHLDVMAGYSWQHFYSADHSVTYFNETGLQKGEDSRYPWNRQESYLVSFYGRINYSIDSRYLFTFTLRDDASSRFSKDTRWGLFPSAAFAWNVKEESFLKGVSPVTALKLRLSVGQTGQQDLNAGDYPALATYMYNSNGSYYMFDGTMIVPIKPNGYNPDLKWETTTTYNVGVDYGFFNDRLFGTLDLYYRETTDLLNNIPVPAGANLANYLTANIGSLINKGVEFEINGVAIQTPDWNWTIGANFAYNYNRITKLTTNDDPSYTGVETGGISGGVGNNVQRHMVGYAANTFYLYEQIYDENGAPIPGAYVDQNNDGVIDAKDRVFKGQAAPKWTIGFNTSLSWRNLTLSISGHGNLGQMVYNNNASRLSLLSDLWTNNFVRNCMGNSMSLGFGNAAYLSDYWLEDGSFFKIDRITLSYLFDLGKGGSLSLFGTVQNVATFTKYSGIDPEVFSGIDNNLYPRPRTYILGLKYNF